MDEKVYSHHQQQKQQKQQQRNQQQPKKTLEDYIFDMETRPTTSNNPEDVWSLLQQKENDLLLAAELGKALLEKNEELKKNQDKIVEEYSVKLEVSFLLFVLFVIEFI